MKIAYLLLTHSNAAQTRLLIRSLNGPWANFYVHVDKSTEINVFSSSLADTENVTMIPQRINVKRCGFAMVEATLALLEFAAKAHPHDYYILLSESHYPIKPNATILETLADSKFEYLNATLMPSEGNSAPLSRLEYFYVPSKARASKFTASLNYRLRQLPPRNIAKGLEGRRPYAGSQWWAISGPCTDFVLNFVRTNRRFCRFFRFTETPDEMFFQTIIANSHFGSRIRPGLTYVDWCRKSPPYPSMLDSSDIPILRNSDKLFARKFDIRSDPAVFDNIEMHLRS